MTILSIIIAPVLLYILPILIGRVILKFLLKSHPIIYPVVSYFIVGSLLLYAFSGVASYVIIPLLPQTSFGTILQTTVVIFSIAYVAINIFLTRTDLNIKKYLLPLGVAVSLSIPAYALWQLHSPYSLNWDIYEHQTLINNMLSFRFSFITSQISDTFGFNGYSTVFHTLIATSQSFIKVPLPQYWQSVTIAHTMLVVFASYLLAKEITGKTAIAVISATLGALIFDSNLSLTTFFLIPQTFIAVIFAFLFVQLISQIKHRQLPSVWAVVINCLFLFISHYIIGAAAALIYLITYLYYRHQQLIDSKLNKRLLVEVGLFMALLSIIFSTVFSLGFLNKGEGEFYTASIVEKFAYMRQSYGFLMLLFVPIGISAVIKRKNELEILALLIALAVLSVVLLQFPYVMKFYVLGRFFVNLIIAIGIYEVLQYIKIPILRIVSYIFLVVCLASILIINASTWKNYLNYNDMLTHLSPNELAAAQFLKSNYSNQDVLLVSDPATQNVLEAFSFVNTQGGAYANQHTRDTLDSIYKASTTQEIANSLYNINDELNKAQRERLFAVSGRYFIWQNSKKEDKHSFAYNVWHPADLTFDNKNYINVLKSDPRFLPVFENPSMVIFKVSL